jgi:hypothetical protein
VVATIVYTTGTGNTGTGSGEAGAASIAVNAGDFCIAHVAIQSTSVTVSSITVKAGVNYTLLDGPIDQSTNVRSYLYYYKATSSQGTNAPTLALSGSARHAWSVAVYSGVASAAPYFDGATSATGSGASVQNASKAFSSNSMAMAISGTAAVKSVNAASTITIAPGNSETERQEKDLAGGTSARAVSDQIQEYNTSGASPRTMTAACTCASSTVQWVIQVVTLIGEHHTTAFTANANLQGNLAKTFTSNATLVPSAVYIIDSYSASNTDSSDSLQTVHPSSGGNYSAAGQCFLGKASYTVSNVLFNLKKVGVPTGNLVVALYAVTGTPDTDATPTGAALATSDSVSIATLNTTYDLVNFNFSTSPVLSAQYYFCCVQIQSATLVDGSNYVDVAFDGSAPSHGGNLADFKNSAWSAYNWADAPFYVYGKIVGIAKTFTGNASLLKNLTATFTANSNLQQNITKTFTSNANLLQNLTKSFTANANLQKNIFTSFTTNASLLKNISQTFTASANLTQTQTTEFTGNANLKQLLFTTFTANAELINGTITLTSTFTADATLTIASPLPAQILGGGIYPTRHRGHEQKLSHEILAQIKRYLELKSDNEMEQ